MPRPKGRKRGHAPLRVVIARDESEDRRWFWLIEGTVIVASSIVATLVLSFVFHA